MVSQNPPPGTVVLISGLQNAAELNGMLGVVKRVVNEEERVEVFVSGPRKAIAIKPCSIQKVEESNERRYQHAAFGLKSMGGSPWLYLTTGPPAAMRFPFYEPLFDSRTQFVYRELKAEMCKSRI